MPWKWLWPNVTELNQTPIKWHIHFYTSSTSLTKQWLGFRLWVKLEFGFPAVASQSGSAECNNPGACTRKGLGLRTGNTNGPFSGREQCQWLSHSTSFYPRIKHPKSALSELTGVMRIYTGDLPSQIPTSKNIQLKRIYCDRKRCLSFLKALTGLCSTTAFVNIYLPYSIIKPFWKAGGKASLRKYLHSPPSSAILPPFLLLLNPMLHDLILLLISNLLPFAPALGLVISLTDLFQFPKSAGKKAPKEIIYTHCFIFLAAQWVAQAPRGVCWKAKLVQWSAQSMWAVTEGGVCTWRQQMQCWECSLWQSEV